jgi:hypothetical protein
MDATGSELTHAVIKIDEDVSEKPLHPSGEHQAIADHDWDEKRERGTGHSASSSEDGQHEKPLDPRMVKVEEAKDGDEAYGHLPPHEREIVKKQLEIPTVNVTFKTLYRYATTYDIIIILISSICAVAGGAIQPVMTVGRPTHASEGPEQLKRLQDRLWAIDRHFPRVL